jgi:large subunit ribosomal protein L11
LKEKQGSAEPNKKKIGTLTKADLAEIAEIKKPAMNTNNIDSIIKSIIGTAKSLGIEVK